MENENLIKRGKELIEEVASILERLSDAQVMDMLGTGALDQLLRAIFDPDTDKSKYANLQEFLLANRGELAP